MSGTTPKIAIIGAGPASLTLANILQNKQIPFTVYEAADVLRDQGGTLDLHHQAGQLALREAGLWSAFEEHCRPESDCKKLMELNGEVLWDENAADAHETSEELARPEIDRSKLMALLLHNIKSSSIQWNKKLLEVVPGAQPHQHNLHFSDQTIEKDFDIIVGGDGAWSKVRNVLTASTPDYSGVSVLELWVDDVSNKNPWLSEYVGKGSLMAFGQDKCVIAQRIGDGSIRTYACLRCPENYLTKGSGIDWSNPGAARERLVEEHFSDLGADHKRLIIESSDKLIPRTLYHLPVGFTWPSCAGITLMGDAAHLMTPFAGVGVNAAMLDALGLSREIHAACTGEKSLETALADYEKAMFARGAKFAKKTMEGFDRHFSENGTRRLRDMLKEHFGKK